KLNPDSLPVSFNCDFHKWMSAKAWVFDHPYADVSSDGRDKRDFGTFEIKNVPTGVEVFVVAWHEAANPNYLLPEGKGSGQGQAITLKDGETKELTIKVKR